MSGALKGIGDTKHAFILNEIGCLLIGLPLQIILFSVLDEKFYGIWIGLPIGMLSVCILYFWRFTQNDYESAIFNMLRAKEEQEMRELHKGSFDKILSFKSPPKKIVPSQQK